MDKRNLSRTSHQTNAFPYPRLPFAALLIKGHRLFHDYVGLRAWRNW